MEKIFLTNKLWTIISIKLIFENENFIQNVLKKINEIIENFENKYSRFKESSQISILNKHKKIKLDEEFLDIINKCIYLHNFSDWYFNPLINLNFFWYDKSFEKINKQIDIIVDIEEIKKKMDLRFNNIKIKNWYLEIDENMNFDLWWIWKWYLVDILKKYLLENNITDFLINLWWDIWVFWNNLEKKNWGIWIQNPLDKEWIICYLEIWNKIICSSWWYERFWKIKSNTLNHIINPKSLSNNNDFLWVSVIWDEWFFCDWIAKSIFNMNLDEWVKFINKNNIDCILITQNKKIILSEWLTNKYKFVKV